MSLATVWQHGNFSGARRLELIWEHMRDAVERERDELHEYQEECLDFLRDNPFSAAFLDTGLGKTATLLTLIDELLTNESILRVLIIAPIRVATQTWPNEIAKWGHTCWLPYTVIRAEDDDPEVISAGKVANDNFKARADYQELKAARDKAVWRAQFALDTADDAMGRKEAQEALKLAQALPSARGEAGRAATAAKEAIRCRKLAEKTPIHIIDIEHIKWLVQKHTEWKVKVKGRSRKRYREVVDWPYDMVVIDESSKFKDHGSDRYKHIEAVRRGPWIKRLHELTATPAAESYMGLFAQVFLMDKGERLGANITSYRDRFFRNKPHSKSRFQYELMPGMQEVISDKIADICLVMRSRDYLDEEDPNFITRPINFQPWELKRYKRFEREFLLDVGDAEETVIEAETAAVLSSKLLQLSSGTVYGNDKRVHHFHDYKLDDLDELIESLQGSPIMVSYWYKPSLARLKKRFPTGQTMDKAGKRLKDWNAGKIPILFVHPASIGHGLNMQEGPGHNIYFFDMCWSYELYYQLYRRLHRQGQQYRVNVHLPQMVDTIDCLVSDRLLAKEDAQEFLFARIRAFRRKMVKRQQMRIAA